MRSFTWCVDAGASLDTELRTNVVSFGDGYEQVSSFGINNARKSWQCTKTGSKAELDAIYDFLIEHKGVEPFYMTFNEVQGMYRTDGGIGYQHQSGSVWRLSFNVRQVFLP